MGIWVIRTAESVVLTPCPPQPLLLNTSTLISVSLISISFVSVNSGNTETAAKEVCLRALESNGLEFEESEIQMVPTTTVPLDSEGEDKVQKLIDSLEDLDDVMNVYTNLD